MYRRIGLILRSHTLPWLTSGKQTADVSITTLPLVYNRHRSKSHARVCLPTAEAACLRDTTALVEWSAPRSATAQIAMTTIISRLPWRSSRADPPLSYHDFRTYALPLFTLRYRRRGPSLRPTPRATWIPTWPLKSEKTKFVSRAAGGT